MDNGMDRSSRRLTSTLAALGVAAATLALAATALAAHPHAGKRYAGVLTNVEKIEGFSAPITFRVSPSGTTLVGFRYGTFGCFGAGGFRPGVNPYTGNSLITVGPITVAENGTFSIKGSKSKLSFKGQYASTTVTTTQVTGKFVNRKTATGTISFTQTETPKTGKPFSCGPAPRTFRATLR
jgi:hypothetical protein